MLNVLFLCTPNSARSILAEATLNHVPRRLERLTSFPPGTSLQDLARERAIIA